MEKAPEQKAGEINKGGLGFIFNMANNNKSNLLKANIFVQIQYGSMPIQNTCSSWYKLQLVEYQLTYILKRPNNVSCLKLFSYLLPVCTLSLFNSPYYNPPNNSSIGAAE